jgi:pimeloyl-ACP methyl ester carboxylesterase
MALAQSRISRGYVEIADGQVHTRTMDGAGPAIVMLHQTASSGAMFEAMMHRLAGIAPMIALDTPGFGNSFEPDHAPSIEVYAGWVCETLDALGIGRCHLLGHHTGGCIAVAIAATRPERVLSLAVIGPVYLDQAAREAFRKHYSRPFEPAWDRVYLQETWDYIEKLGSSADIKLHHREFTDMLRAWKGRADAYKAVWDNDQIALYAAVTCPLLLLAAPQDVLMPCLEAALAALPEARTASISGANFEPDLDPDGCADAMRAFLSAYTTA